MNIMMMLLQSAAALIMSLNQPNGDVLPDFSRVGYQWGDKEIPKYKVKTVLEAPADGADATAMIQAAIDGHEGERSCLRKDAIMFQEQYISIKADLCSEAKEMRP